MAVRDDGFRSGRRVLVIVLHPHDINRLSSHPHDQLQPSGREPTRTLGVERKTASHRDDDDSHRHAGYYGYQTGTTNILG